MPKEGLLASPPLIIPSIIFVISAIDIAWLRPGLEYLPSILLDIIPSTSPEALDITHPSL